MLIQFGLMRFIFVHLGPPTVLLPLLTSTKSLEQGHIRQNHPFTNPALLFPLDLVAQPHEPPIAL